MGRSKFFSSKKLLARAATWVGSRVYALCLCQELVPYSLLPAFPLAVTALQDKESRLFGARLHPAPLG